MGKNGFDQIPQRIGKRRGDHAWRDADFVPS
jgi:hypothetical protein